MIEILQNLSFWDKLNEFDKQGLVANTAPLAFSAGQNVHDPADRCLGVMLIYTGGLRVYMMSDDGREITLYRLSDGDVCVMSASCVLNNITFDVFIDAERDTELYVVNAAYFSHLSERNVYVENFALKITVDMFSEVMWTMEQVLFMSFDRRLAIFLLDEASKSGKDAINLTHEQIAKYVGSAREVVSRMLKYFEKEGFVSLSRGEVEIKDKNRLREIL